MQENKTKFSPEQETAINTRDRTLLVSAAAGSGKTTTLTERIIRSLLNENHPESLQNMLIVTFTNASVYDLKEKISKALLSAVNENPSNKRLERELRGLGHARIMTIDSFCAEVVRTHAEKLGITPSYRISESSEMLILERSLLEGLTEAAYSGELSPNIEPRAFEVLCDALTGVKNTGSLSDILISLYEKTKSSVRGVKIFSDFADTYKKYSLLLPEETEYGKYAMNMARESFDYFESVFSHYTLPLLSYELGPQPLLANQISDIAASLKKIGSFSDKYEKMREALFDFKFPKAPVFRDEKDEASLLAIDFRNEIKDTLAKLKDTVFSYTAEEWRTLYAELSSHIETLAKFLRLFEEIFFEEKRRRGALEFSDVERLAYNVLYKDGNITDTAREYRELFTSVYIDEYQDVNELQNKIFEAVSPPAARFMVGDIKQSIYGFRSARPEIFADMKKRLPPLTEKYNPESSIFMSNNYRCDEAIINFVNNVFDKLFGACKESVGYEYADRLIYKKSYEKNEPDYEPPTICLVPTNESDDSEDGAVSKEAASAQFVAKRIKKLLESETRSDGSKIEPKDVAIILRTKKNFSQYQNALLKEGIAARAAEDRDFFLNKEILLTLSLLNSIDNPRRDVYLASLMCSPLYSFSADELYLIRQCGSKCLYEDLKEYAKRNPKFTKLTNFLDTLAHFRAIAEGMSVASLLTRLYRESGLLALASKQGGKENLQKLYGYAKKFEGSSYKGLYSFISYINNIVERADTIDKTQGSPSEENTVNIITIHSSKGLEFPVVFLADTSNPIINLDNRDRIAFSENFGMSFLLRAPRGLALVDNPLYHVIHDFADKKFVEENIRLLYVALTRAKERLFVVGTCSEDPSEYIEKTRLSLSALNAYSLRRTKSYMDMILGAADYADIDVADCGADTPVKNTEESIEAPYEEETSKLGTQSSDLKDELLLRFNFAYKNEHLTALPEKLSVSKLYPTVLDGTEEQEISLSKEGNEVLSSQKEYVPAFISGAPADVSAKRGIATHNFMQFFDIAALAETDVKTELDRLVQKGFISEKNASLVRLDELYLFEKSELFSNMINANRLFREFRFNTRLPARLFTADEEKRRLFGDYTVLVQGVIDCIIENADGTLRLIDYKTDRLTRQELTDEDLARKKLSEKHSRQLFYYSLAVERIFGKKPMQTEIYSLPLGKTVKIF